METELKLLLDPAQSEAILKHPVFTSHSFLSKPQEHDITDTYFDTPDLALRHSEIGLRVRKVDGAWIQTIKAGGNALGGLHSRPEWETPVAGPAPELPRLCEVVEDKKLCRDLISKTGRRTAVAPVFATKVRRTLWDLELPDGDHIECALDQGRVECGDKHAPISELELEMKSGNPAQLFDLALTLHNDIPLHIGNQSKADRGYALLQSLPATTSKARALMLSQDMTVEQAFQAIGFNCLTHIQANAEGVAQRHDVESLHQMRVGMRRLRSALSMFKSVLQLPQLMQADLDWLTGALGEARDWDVLALSTLALVQKQAHDGAQVAELQQAAKQTADEYHLSAAAAVLSPRFTKTLLMLTRWLLTMGWHDDHAGAPSRELSKPVTRFAHKVLKRDQRRLRARAHDLRHATAEARHRVRIAAKKTRYAAEFFQSLLNEKTVRPYIKGLTGLQDELGFLNDVAVAERLLSTLSANRPELQANASFVKGFLAARVDSDNRMLDKRWKKFDRIGMPR